MKLTAAFYLLSGVLINVELQHKYIQVQALKNENSIDVYFTKILSSNKNVWVSRNASSEITVGDRISTTANSTVKIYCPFKGMPYPRVTWFFNDRVIDHVKFKNIDIMEPKEVSILVIRKLDEEHDGRYTCMVFNKYETQKSTAFVRLIEPFQPTIFSTRLSKEYLDNETAVTINIGTNATLYDGSNLKIRCDIKTVEQYSITWMFNSIPLNIRDSNSAELVIQNLISENSGLYTCKVNNKRGKGDVQFSLVTVIKKLFPKIYESHETLRYIRGSGDAKLIIGDNATVREGFNVKISCSYYAVPKGKLTWERQGVVLLNDFPSGKSHDDKYISRYVISSVQMKHSGDYTCVAANVMGKVAVSSRITVIPANSGFPKIQTGSRRRTVEILSAKTSVVVKIGEFVRIIEGAPLKLQCISTGVPKPDISWFLNREALLDDSVIQTSNMLLILNFQPRHAGDYKCVAKNAVGEVRAFSEVRIIIPKAPHIIMGHSVFKKASLLQSAEITIGDHLKSPGGRDISIRCPASGYPNVEILWMHESNMLQNSEKIFIDSVKQILTIKNSNEWDSGKYACFASNSAGISSGFSFLKILAPGSPVITSHDAVRIDFGVSPNIIIEIGTNLTTTTGKVLSILCPSDGAELTLYEWTINNEHLNYDARINVVNGSELVINGLQLFDEGVYQCRAFTQQGFDVMISKITIIDKQQEKQQQNEDYPKNLDSGIILKDDITALKGSSPALTCAIPEATRPQLKWYKNGNLISLSNKYLPRGEQLVLNFVDEESAGEYTCVIATQSGVTQIIFRVKIEEHLPVTIKKSNKTYTITETMKQTTVTIGDKIRSIPDANIKLTCPYVAKPNATVYWLHNNRLIKQGDMYITNVHANDLIIPKMDKKNVGLYMCRAVQGERKDEALTYIELLDLKRPVIYKSNRNLSSEVYSKAFLKINIGDSLIVNLKKQLEITCEGEGLPIPRILWKFNGESIAKLNFVSDLKNGSLLVEQVLWEHDGKFECFFLNSFGFDYASSSVSVVGEFSPIIFKPTINHVSQMNATKETVKVNIGTNITIRTSNNLQMLCPVDVFGEVDVIWYKDDKLLKVPQHGNSIQFNNLIVEDSGSYVCFSNDPAKFKFGSVEVNVVAPVHEVIERSDIHHMEYLENKLKQLNADVGAQILILTGNSIKFRCPVKENSKVKVAWLKNYEHFLEKDESFYRVFVFSEEGIFNISCQITSVLGSDFVTSQVTVVAPKSPTILKVDQDIMSVKSHSAFHIGGSVKVFDGSSVEIKCETNGFPKPKVVWNYQGKQIKGGTNVYFKEDGGKTLAIFSVSKIHEGIYSCSASNGFGPDVQQSIKIYVYIPKKPEIIKSLLGNDKQTANGPTLNNWSLGEKFTLLAAARNPPTIVQDVGGNYEVLAGSTFKLKCDTVGEPSPSIEWRKDGFDISKDVDHFVIETNDVTNSGLYTCTALNEFGAVTESSMINIIVAIQPTIQHQGFGNGSKVIKHVNGSKSVEVFIGDDLMTFSGTVVYLKCLAAGIPTPNITFFKDGNPITSNENITVDNTGLLLLSTASEESGGVYTCLAENVAGFVELNTTLTMYHPLKPKIESAEQVSSYYYNKTTKQSILHLTIGHSATSYPNTKVYIKCPVAGFPLPDIIWKVNDEIVMEDREVVLSDNKTILIYNLDNHVSQTTFVCIAANLAGLEESLSVIQIVDMLPAEILFSHFKPIKKEDMDVKICIGENADVLAGSTVSITCPAVGEPKPELFWSKQGSPSKWLESNKNVSIKDNLLILYNVEQVFGGQYSCNVSNVFGSSIKTSTISIKEREIPKIVSSNKTFVADRSVNVIRVLIGTKIYARKNIRVIIECPVSGVPQPELVWYKNDLILVHQSNDMIIIERAEKDDGGVYSCVATNIVGSVQVSTELIVGFEPLMQSVPIDLSPILSLAQNSEVFVPVGVKEVFVRERNTVNLQCLTDAYPVPHIEWFYNGFEIDYSDSKFEVSKNILQVRNLNSKNGGIYSCTVKNPFGEASSKSNLYVMEPPIIKENKENILIKSVPDEMINIQVGAHITITAGATFSLSCFVSGAPFPTIRWLRNNIRFESGERVSLTANKLYFTNVLPQDSASYTCEARNNWGKAKSSTRLLVAEKPVASVSLNFLTNSGVSTIYDESVVVPAGSHILLFCHVTGFPIPRIAWLKDHDVFTGTKEKYQFYNQSAIEIEYLGPNNSGTYICIATNVLGEATGIMTLFIGVSSKILSDSGTVISKNSIVTAHVGSNLEVMPGASVKIICGATGVPKPKILWEITKENSAIQTIQTDSDGEIILRNVSRDDEGLYTCVAQNSIGVDKAASTLSIIDPPRITSFKVQYTKDFGDVFFSNGIFHIIEGESILLVCDATGYPAPLLKIQQSNSLDSFEEIFGFDFKEKFRNKSLSSNLESNVTTTLYKRKKFVRAQIFVGSALLHHSSIYSCGAENYSNHENILRTLIVYPKPEKPNRGVWILSRFGECSTPCVRSNFGLQKREMVCLTLNGEIVDQTDCGPLLKQTLKRECESTICATEWKTADWTTCSATCGDNGKQSRVTYCAYKNSKQRISPTNCLSYTKPDSTRGCNKFPCNREQCVDRKLHCSIIKRAGFCRTEIYKSICCASCQTSISSNP